MNKPLFIRVKTIPKKCLTNETHVTTIGDMM